MELQLKCSCGQVEGLAKLVNPGAGTRLACYCKHCRRFAEALECEQPILDDWGGTEVLQLSPSQLDISKGIENIRCLRLSEKGLYRWYASCCDTPIGNTVSPAVPFVALIHNFIVDKNALGPVKAVNIQSVVDKLPPEVLRTKASSAYIVKILAKVLFRKLLGGGKPSPFYNDSGAPICEPRVLNHP